MYTDKIDDVYSGYKGRIKTLEGKNAMLNKLYRRYEARKVDTILDAMSAAASIGSIVNSDRILMNRIDSKMEEAFHLAFPGRELDSLTSVSKQEITGLVSNWKGKYFELLVNDRLNDHQWVGDIRLGEGQYSQLAESINQPGWDIEIFNADGTYAEQLQLKATDSLGYIKSTLEKYPDIRIITTDDLDSIPDVRINEFAGVVQSDINDGEIERKILEPMANIADTPFEDFVEFILPFLPFIIIATSEGIKYFMKKKTLDNAIKSGLFRSVKTGAAMAVGGFVVYIGLGFMSIPTAFATRLIFDKKKRVADSNKGIMIRREQLAQYTAR